MYKIMFQLPKLLIQEDYYYLFSHSTKIIIPPEISIIDYYNISYIGNMSQMTFVIRDSRSKTGLGMSLFKEEATLE